MQSTIYKDKLGLVNCAADYGKISGVTIYTIFVQDKLTGDYDPAPWAHIHETLELAQRELDEHAQQKGWTAVEAVEED
jgi:hypothetical protein